MKIFDYIVGSILYLSFFFVALSWLILGIKPEPDSPLWSMGFAFITGHLLTQPDKKPHEWFVTGAFTLYTLLVVAVHAT